jgi:acyl carrier protein
LSEQRDQLENELRQLIADIMEARPSEVGSDFGADSCANWTSLRHLMLISQVEDRFDVVFTQAEIQKLTGYAAILESLRRRNGRV